MNDLFEDMNITAASLLESKPQATALLKLGAVQITYDDKCAKLISVAKA